MALIEIDHAGTGTGQIRDKSICVGFQKTIQGGLKGIAFGEKAAPALKRRMARWIPGRGGQTQREFIRTTNADEEHPPCKPAKAIRLLERKICKTIIARRTYYDNLNGHGPRKYIPARSIGALHHQ